ncbi:tetraacyldisaccharide 4'-kinase [Inhella sp. 4Y17]|uniref:Tetraacyldisaccharide 4'-kinase n=1 Tax=Inhella gelatinilytica TaxID=2795030 RepID=A0A931NFB8_9BURK|nr:tetraacyldisaccharide 4'-kinase [Inhella gelatinilytica]
MALWLQRVWRTRGPIAWLLRPFSALYRGLSAAHWRAYAQGRRPISRPPLPVVVVGNWIVGGGGKTPTLMAIIQQLQAQGLRVGVISRGYGRVGGQSVQVACATSTAQDLGDEPLLLWRRTGAPLAVGADRGQAVAALRQQHPNLQLILSDDGLQHHALARDLTVLVFDRRGLGNGWLLPAGPLRQDQDRPVLPGSRADTLVLYTDGVVSTARAGYVAHRRLSGAVRLEAWWAQRWDTQQPLTELRGRPLIAAAGLAQPEGFFALLHEAGLTFQALPQPDHHDFAMLPWPPGSEVVVTEKDATKLSPERLAPGDRVWVLPLDLQPEPAFRAALLHALQPWLGSASHGPTSDRTSGLPPVQGPAATEP